MPGVHRTRLCVSREAHSGGTEGPAKYLPPVVSVRIQDLGGKIDMPRTTGTWAWKLVDAAIAKAAGVTFDTIQFFNKHRLTPSFTQQWSEKPHLKSWEKSEPTLGWPRTTDSLCPGCVKEAREEIFAGR